MNWNQLSAPVMWVRIGFAVYVGLFGTLTYLKYWAVHTHAFDLGIFAQMFHSMSTDGTQMTTIERNCLLSHFSIHISPALYFLVPLFKLFPSPVTLLHAQTLLLAAGAFPLFRLATARLHDDTTAAFLSLSYLLGAGIHRANIYDFHEVALAVPLLLWSFYFIETGRTRWASVLLLAAVLVKEEMPVVIFWIGIYIAMSKRQYLYGVIIAACSVMYYALITEHVFPAYGGAPMYARYSQLMPDGANGCIQVIHRIAGNPGLILGDLCSINKLVPVGDFLVRGLFLPCMSMGGGLLLMPVFIINVLSNYPEQYQFQCHYGAIPTCLLFYGVIVTMQHLPQKYYRRLGWTILTTAVLLVPFHMKVPEAVELFRAGRVDQTPASESAPPVEIRKPSAGATFVASLLKRLHIVKQVKAELARIPGEDSVWSSTRFAAHLSQRKALYLFPKALRDREHVDWLVLDLRQEPKVFLPLADRAAYISRIVGLLEGREYGVSSYVPDGILVLKKGFAIENNSRVSRELADGEHSNGTKKH